MDLPQRPQLWMHRTRSFWFGLVGLIGLGAAWLGCTLRVTVSHPSLLDNDWRIRLNNGCLVVEKHPGPGPGEFDISHWWGPNHTDFWPDPILAWPDRGRHPRYLLQLPIWPLIPLWVIAWLWWMARKDRRETAYFSGVNMPGAK